METELGFFLIGEEDHAPVVIQPVFQDPQHLCEDLRNLHLLADRLADFIGKESIVVVDVHLVDVIRSRFAQGADGSLQVLLFTELAGECSRQHENRYDSGRKGKGKAGERHGDGEEQGDSREETEVACATPVFHGAFFPIDDVPADRST